MKENSQSKQGKSLLVFNQVVVRIMIHTNPKIKIKVNQLDLLGTGSQYGGFGSEDIAKFGYNNEDKFGSGGCYDPYTKG